MTWGDCFVGLVGKTVDAVYYHAGNSVLAMVTADGEVHGFSAYGDCCANAYFEAPEQAGFDQIIGHEVTACDERGGGTFEGDDVANDVTFYSIKTARGVADVELRVSHNGYYGGDVAPTKVDASGIKPPSWKLLAGQRRCVKHDDCRSDRGLGVACAQAVRP